MSGTLAARVDAMLAAPVADPVRAFAAALGTSARALGVLFYGSNLRTGSLDGVLDFYVLLPGPRERGIWPRVSYHEREDGGRILRAKVATMTLATFAAAAAGETRDTTIWARFVQPSALAWVEDSRVLPGIAQAVAGAARTAASLAAALGPEVGLEEGYWRALFRATYAAEFRVEKAGREESILAANRAHFTGLLPAALESAGITATVTDDGLVRPQFTPVERQRLLVRWGRWRRSGKPLNVLRLLKASTTFEGAARYAAWKIERHTGIPVPLNPWHERHPVLAAPGVLWRVWRAKRKMA